MSGNILIIHTGPVVKKNEGFCKSIDIGHQYQWN